MCLFLFIKFLRRTRAKTYCLHFLNTLLVLEARGLTEEHSASSAVFGILALVEDEGIGSII